MFDVLLARWKQKYRTMQFPDGPPPALPDRFRGKPQLLPEQCQPGCSRCHGVCPTGALSGNDGIQLDLGKCLFCGECAAVCSNQAIRFTDGFSMAAGARKDLVLGRSRKAPEQICTAEIRSLFGKSLRLRQVSAGGCGACEADTNVLGTVGWDLGRFGIQFVASPRHADGLLVTGPVTQNMLLGLMKTYRAVPPPKLVILAGTCAISGGLFRDHEEVNNGARDLFPVALHIPGCPPHPLTILDGLLRLIGRLG